MAGEPWAEVGCLLIRPGQPHPANSRDVEFVLQELDDASKPFRQRGRLRRAGPFLVAGFDEIDAKP